MRDKQDTSQMEGNSTQPCAAPEAPDRAESQTSVFQC